MSAVVVILGPPAVGKMTVGQALAVRTGFTLLHNHVLSDIITAYFSSSSPAFSTLIKSMTGSLVLELARASTGLIFTRTHDFEDSLDAEMMAMLLEHSGSAQTCFIELSAPMAVRLARNRSENRLTHKPSKRDLVASEARVRAAAGRCFASPDGALPWPGSHLRLDNSALAPNEVAARICDEFGFAVSKPQPGAL